MLYEVITDGSQLITMLEQMEASYAKLNDYTATFQKQERVGEKLNDREQIFVKFAKPFKVYMKWLETAPKEARITSYNVCYTKLLRSTSSVLPRSIAASSCSAGSTSRSPARILSATWALSTSTAG